MPSHSRSARLPPPAMGNRRAEKWRDKQDIEHSGTVTLEQMVAASMNERGSARYRRALASLGASQEAA